MCACREGGEGGREGREGGRGGREGGREEGGREGGREGREGGRREGKENIRTPAIISCMLHRIEPHLLFAEISLKE